LVLAAQVKLMAVIPYLAPLHLLVAVRVVTAVQALMLAMAVLVVVLLFKTQQEEQVLLIKDLTAVLVALLHQTTVQAVAVEQEQ
jgi:hypothetical protein